MTLIKNIRVIHLRLYILVLLSIMGVSSFAQELDCRVSINSSKVQGTNKQVFSTLQEAIRDFMNTKNWTNNVFEINERIECNLLITITEQPSSDIYKGKIQVQSRRPIYGTSFNSLMLNYIDNDIEFTYEEYDPIEFSPTTHISNLSSILAYYAYMIIGLDYDSYSLMGGTPYFQLAEKIVTNAQSTSESGWKAFESRSRKNRYWFVNNILDDNYKPLRTFNYLYHRQGLDVMAESTTKARVTILEGLRNIKQFHESKPDPFMFYFQVFLDSKSDELVQVFSEATETEKKKVYEIMTEVDPSKQSKYQKLR